MFKRVLKLSALTGGVGGYIWSINNSHEYVDSNGFIRLSRAAFTVFKVGFHYKTNLYKHGLDKKSVEYQELKNSCHQAGAENLLKLCCLNKGVYIKVGQYIAALEYLLPKEYVQTMRVLHSHAPSNNIKDVWKVIETDLGKKPQELFVEFDDEPLGTASLAQVHKARLKDGQIVAVKVQHPYIKKNAIVDLHTMEALFKIVEYVFPEFKFQWIANETKRNIPIELDFELEGRNSEQIGRMLAHFPWLKIPKVLWEYSSPRVLTMEFVEGGQVNDINYMRKNGIKPDDVCNKLGLLYSEMIFTNGFVHSDPHPGNILVKKDKQHGTEIILLDHGLYANLSRYVMVEYANLWLGILNRNRLAMRKHCKNLGIDGNIYAIFACMITGRSWDSIMSGLDSHQVTNEEKDGIQKGFANLLPDITGILDKVNREMLLILKTNDLMRGIEYALKTDKKMKSFKSMSQCCVKSVYKEKIENADNLLSKVANTFTQYWLLFKINVYYVYIGIRTLL